MATVEDDDVMDWRRAGPFLVLGSASILFAVLATLYLRPQTQPVTRAVAPSASSDTSGSSRAARTPTSPPPAPASPPKSTRASDATRSTHTRTTSSRRPTAKPAATTSDHGRTPTSTTSTTSTRTTAAETSRSDDAKRVPATNPAGRIRFGATYVGVATFYAATGEGNCMFDRSPDLMVAAMNQTDYATAAACGAYLRVTGPKGTVTVRVVDRCPECPPGALDLSAEAFARIADPAQGKVPITWTLQSPALAGPIAYRYKEGSSRYWCAIQIRNHRNPIATVEVQVGGAWRRLPRLDYNYAVSADGAGCGGQLRVTDIFGHRVTDRVALRAGAVQPGSAQFASP